MPATLPTLRRVSSIVNNPSTLRGWLAAWRQVHVLTDRNWQGDSDQFLRSVRLGLVKSLGPMPLKQRMRATRLTRVLRSCVRRGLFLEAAAAAISYVFALRVPSELLKQAQCDLFNVSATRISYGPLHRKGHLHKSTLVRHCTRSSRPLLCPHPWVALLQEQRPQGKCFAFTARTLMERLHPALRGAASKFGILDFSLLPAQQCC